LSFAWDSTSNYLIAGTGSGQIQYLSLSGFLANDGIIDTGGQNVVSLAWDHDSDFIATGSTDGLLNVWDYNSRNRVDQIVQTTAIASISKSPNAIRFGFSEPGGQLGVLEYVPPVAISDDFIITDGDNSGSEDVVLNGSASTDSDGTITSYVWTENSTQIATGATPTVNLTVGTHTILLTVTDNDGLTDEDEVVITVRPNNPPTVTIQYGFTFVESRFQSIPNPVIVNVNNEFYTDDPDGDALTYKWEMFRPDASNWATVYEGGDASANLNLGAPPTDYCPITLRLTATDPYGASGSATTTVNFTSEVSTGQTCDVSNF